MKIKKFIHRKPYLISGPCSAESEQQVLQIAKSIEGVADVFRAGVWKPRTNPNSFEGWHGPESMRHDFRNNNISIEVKSTSLKDTKKCRIHGHDQLEKPDNTELYFAYFQFEQDDMGLSIPKLIKEIEQKGISRVDLEKKLNDVGFDFDKWKKYDETSRRYRLINNFYYIVDDNFPKLTSGSFSEGHLPKNVSEIVYQINLEGVPELDKESKDKMIQNFCKEE